MIADAQESPTATINVQGNAVTLHPAPSQTIEVDTSLDPGQAVTVHFRSSDGTRFLVTNQTTVGQDGRLVGAMTLTTVGVLANDTASVMVDEERIDGSVPVQIVEGEPSTAGQLGFGVVATLGSLLSPPSSTGIAGPECVPHHRPTAGFKIHDEQNRSVLIPGGEPPNSAAVGRLLPIGFQRQPNVDLSGVRGRVAQGHGRL